MSDYRTVQTGIWDEDEWFAELPIDGKLLFIYLFTNKLASIAGIYKLPLRTIQFNTGIKLARIKDLFSIFQEAEKVFYEDGVVWVKRMRRYQAKGSSKLLVKIISDLAILSDCPLKKRYLKEYPINTISDKKDTVDIPSPPTEPTEPTDTTEYIGDVFAGEEEPTADELSLVTVPDIPDPLPQPDKLDLKVLPESFQSFCSAYPKAVDKRPTYRAWYYLVEKAPKREQVSSDDLITCARRFALEMRDREPKHIKAAEVFLSAKNRWFEKYLESNESTHAPTFSDFGDDYGGSIWAEEAAKADALTQQPGVKL